MVNGYPYSFECIISQGNPTEYFCKRCKQLRLSCITDKSKCGNCGSTDIVHGEVGTLSKEQLLRKGDV